MTLNSFQLTLGIKQALCLSVQFHQVYLEYDCWLLIYWGLKAYLRKPPFNTCDGSSILAKTTIKSQHSIVWKSNFRLLVHQL